MATVSGEMQAGEASGAVGPILRRLHGSKLYYYMLMLGLYAAGAALGLSVGATLRNFWPKADVNLFTLIGFVLGGVVYLRVYRPWTVQRFRDRMEARGLKLTFGQRMEITEASLIRQTGEVQTIAPWSAVTELVRTKGYWVFLVQTDPWFLPSRFFTDQADEKAFLAEALKNMSPAARTRSPDAEAFALG